MEPGPLVIMYAGTRFEELAPYKIKYKIQFPFNGKIAEQIFNRFDFSTYTDSSYQDGGVLAFDNKWDYHLMALTLPLCGLGIIWDIESK